MSEQIDSRVAVENVVACFMVLNEPQRYKDNPNNAPRWSTTFLFRKDDPEQVSQFEHVKEVASLVAQNAISGITAERYNVFAKPWIDGGTCDPEKYPPVYCNSFAIRTYRSAKQGPPSLREGHDPSIIIPNEKADARFPDGAVVNGVFDIFLDTTHGAPRVCAGLVALQIISPGDGFGGAKFVAENYFKPHKVKPLGEALAKEETPKKVVGWG